MGAWDIELEPIRDWLDEQDRKTTAQILAALRRLREEGPHLGRPLVDTVTGSRYPNMKELRPGSSRRSAIRILFIFDPHRRAILLIGGDKRTLWNRWYDKAIPLAEQRYKEYLHTHYDGQQT